MASEMKVIGVCIEKGKLGISLGRGVGKGWERDGEGVWMKEEGFGERVVKEWKGSGKGG
jgi:hypothetical protein